MLVEGEVALLGDEGLEAINALARELGQASVVLIRSEQSQALQDRTMIGYAGALPLVWVAAQFSPEASKWAHDRGPMTLLVDCGGTLDAEQQQRIDRFVAILGRQSE